MANDKPSLMPGEVLDGKYRIDRVIGEGGMGIVYEAVHVEIGRKVAIKRLHKNYTTDPQIVGRFHREARLAGSIGHDNICEVTDIGSTPDGAPYLVMPLLTGQSLGAVLDGQKPLSLMRVVDIVCQALSALDAAHRAKIVHRDLKPDNIFVTKVGDRDDFVKLLDFGISKIMDQESVGKLTRTGTVLGTPYYMSPEQAMGSKAIDHRVDIYAMGVILYECLTGRRPFEGDTYNEVMFKIISSPFSHPRVFNPEIPSNVEEVILKAMSRDPQDRYASSTDMRQVLQAAIAVDADQILAVSTRTSTAVSSPRAFTPGRGGARASAPSPESAISRPSRSMVPIEAHGRRKLILATVVMMLLVLGSVALVLVMTRNETRPAPVSLPLSLPSLPQAKKDVPPVPAVPPPAPAEAKPPEPVLEKPQITAEKPHRSRDRTATHQASSETKPKPESDQGMVKGRARTTIVSDYEE